MDATAHRDAPGAGTGTRCPQCGGPVAVRNDTPLARCPHCRATLWMDVDRLVRHATLRPKLGPGEARGALQRFLRAAEVDTDARGPAPRLEFHAWYQVPTARGPRLVQASAHAAFANAPKRAAEAGDSDPAEPEILRDAFVAEPEISLAEAVARVEGGRGDGARLVHVPVWAIEFGDDGSRYTAHVDAVEGEVSALALPPASTRRLDRVAALWLAGAIALFAAEAALVRGMLPTLGAFAVTGVALYALVRAGERKGA